MEVTTILRPNDYHENHSGGSTSVVDPLQEQGIRHNFTQFVPPYTICALYTICAVICTGGAHVVSCVTT